MKKSYYVFINDRGRTVRIPKLLILAGIIVVFSLGASTVYALHSGKELRVENYELKAKNLEQSLEIKKLEKVQKEYKGYISSVKTEINEIKTNFETYKTEVEKNVRKK